MWLLLVVNCFWNLPQDFRFRLKIPTKKSQIWNITKGQGFSFPKTWSMLRLDPWSNGTIMAVAGCRQHDLNSEPSKFWCKEVEVLQTSFGDHFGRWLLGWHRPMGHQVWKLRCFWKKYASKQLIGQWTNVYRWLFMNQSWCHATSIIVSYIQLRQSYAKTCRHWAKMESC